MSKTKKDENTKAATDTVKKENKPKAATSSDGPKKSKEEKTVEKINKGVLPMANLNNRINSMKKNMDDRTQGISSTEKAVNIERAIFLKTLEEVQAQFIEYFSSK